MAIILARLHRLLQSRHWRYSSSPSPSSLTFFFRNLHRNLHSHLPLETPLLNLHSFSSDGFHLVGISSKRNSSLFCSLAIRFMITCSSGGTGLGDQDTSFFEEIVERDQENPLRHYANEEVDPIDSWEEEEETEPMIGDGGDGGGVVLQNCPWGERVLSIAHEVLVQCDNDLKLYAFKTSPRGYIYVRLDKLCNLYGCPSMEDIENYSHQYKKRLDEIGATGEIPDDLALEVSSPSAERLLKVPDDLNRFKELPMRVWYVEEMESKSPEKIGVFFLESIDSETECCVWKLADVKENRDPSAKGRPLNRKQKDWRLKLPYEMFKRVTLFLDY